MKIHRCSVDENKITFSGYCLYSRDVWDRVLEIFRQVTAVPVNLCDLYPWVLNGVSNEYYTERFLPEGRIIAVRILSPDEDPEIGAEVVIIKERRAIVFHVERTSYEYTDVLGLSKTMKSRREEYLKQASEYFIKDILY